MTKHILDGPRIPGSPAKTVRFTKFDAEARPKPQSKALQRRHVRAGSDALARRFLELDRRIGA